jgi:hypothetical protein
VIAILEYNIVRVVAKVVLDLIKHAVDTSTRRIIVAHKYSLSELSVRDVTRLMGKHARAAEGVLHPIDLHAAVEGAQAPGVEVVVGLVKVVNVKKDLFNSDRERVLMRKKRVTQANQTPC